VANRLNSHWPISLTNGVATMFNLFLPLALVRIISPAEVGRYKVFFLYVMLSPGLFLTGGLNNGLYHWGGRYPDTQRDIRQSWTWLLGISLLASALGLAIASLIAPSLKMPASDLRLFFVYCPLGLAGMFIEDLMIARGDIWKGSIYGSGFQVLRSAATLAAAYLGRRVEYVLFAFLVCSILRLLVGWMVMRSSGDLKLLFSKTRSTEVLRYAFPVSVAALAGMALTNIDQLILSFRLHPAEFAFYSMGCLTVPPLLILEISVNRVMIPKLSNAFGARQAATAASLFAEGMAELFRFLLPATIGLMLFAHPIIRILFTDRYVQAADYLRYYAFFYLIMCIPYDAVARAIGDGVWILRMSLIFAPISVAATYFSTLRWGAMGALLAALLMQLAMRIYGLLYTRRHFQRPLADFIPVRHMLEECGIAVAAAGIALVLRPVFADERAWFLVCGLLFTVIYFGGTYLLVLRRNARSDAPIQVLELVQFLSVGGLERMVYSLSRALNQNDRFRPMVAAYDRMDLEPEASLVPRFEEAGIPLVQWEKKDGFSLRIVTRLIQLVLSENRRILHAHDLGPLIYGSIAKFLALGRVQLVFTLHTLLHTEQSARYRAYFRFFLRFADRIVAVSPAIKNGLITLGIDPDRIEIVPNGIPFVSAADISASARLELKRRLLPSASPELLRARWMLCLARVLPTKRQKTALDVWRALPPEIRQGMALIFIGPPSDGDYARSLKAEIAGCPDRDQVIWAGPTLHPELWLQAGHLFFSASEHEGMPLAPLEAAGSGLITVLSDIPGHQFLKPWARLFTLSEPEEAAREIVAVMRALDTQEDTAFFERQWNAAQPLRLKWSETAMVASYMDVFESIWNASQPEVPKNAYAAWMM
jgi:O-antigen/teichoic acid export membrane protein/glycosyltransferase involved in cell wall biosynthesis